jgi:hypothetical protein
LLVLQRKNTKSMTADARIAAFQGLGAEVRMILDKRSFTAAGERLMTFLPSAHVGNAWFTEENVRHRLESIAANLDKEVMEQWLSKYSLPNSDSGKTIGVIAAGNIPLAGFDDFFHTLLCGHNYSGKLSKDDNKLLPLLAEIVMEIEPEFRKKISFTEGKLGKIDAVIATGSNNSSRYFEYYFSQFPYVIRRNRNSIAVLTGRETSEELTALGEDIFRYFGLGCRNVTKLFVPEGYVFDPLFEALFVWGDEMMSNRKYMNNYEYNRTIYMLNSEKMLDNNFLVIKEDKGIASPPGVLFYETYTKIEEVLTKLKVDVEHVQCVVSVDEEFSINKPGSAQKPFPWEYADGVDTMEFLLKQ